MYNQLTRGQRYAICPGLQEGKSRKAIAPQINIHPSTVGREIKRNPTRSGHYGRRVAQESADIRKDHLPGNRRIDGKVLKEADGKRFGDWEMDLVIGKRQKSALLTLCERSVNYLLMARLPHGKNPEKVADMAVKLLFPCRKNMPTITTDNGGGSACHEKTARRLGTTACFADSYASWQKGTVGNANKLVRQYMLKGTGFREIFDGFIRQIRYKINRRPREKLNFSSPKKKFFNLIA